MNNRANVWVLGAKRTPVGKALKGALSQVRPDDLLNTAIQALFVDCPIERAALEDVIMGCAMPEAEQGMNVARIASLLAGIPPSVPAMTINRFCCSGVQSVALGAQKIALGEADLILAGGLESMSLVPLGGHHLSFNPRVFDPSHEHVAIAYGMGITAERVAQHWQVDRASQDEFAFQSHQRALLAQAENAFDAEIAPHHWEASVWSEGQKKIEKRSLFQDEGPRRDSTLEALARLKPAFARNGSVTAGNSSQMSDGAGALLLASDQYVKQHQLKPLARFVGFEVAGVPPEFMGIGPIEAIPKVLKRAGLTLKDIDWIELNEAFAAQSLAVIRSLDLDPERVNPLGGAIALGHPLGATGAIRAATLLHGLKRTAKRYGLVTMCIGTGMGAAALFESV